MTEEKETRPKGDDIGYFDLLKENLEDIRKARNTGEPEDYQRAVIGALINLEVYLDEGHRKEIAKFDKDSRAGATNRWDSAKAMHTLIIRIIAKQGFIPMSETTATLDDLKTVGEVRKWKQ